MTVVFAPSDGSQGFNGYYTPDLTLQVACSYNLKTCPKGKILDDVQSASGPVEVSGSPPPLQHVVVGQQMKVSLAWKAGTGTSGYTYAVATSPSPYWHIPGNSVESYNLGAGTGPVQLTSSDYSNNPTTFYFLRGANPQGDEFDVDAQFDRSDGREHALVTTRSLYLVDLPNVTKTNWDSLGHPLIGQVDGYTALGFGNPGIKYDFRATAPQGGSGLVVAEQVIQNSITVQPASAPTPPSTGFQTTDLDQCIFYAAPVAIAASASATWTSSDTPSSELTNNLTQLTRSDYFTTYFMYRPTSTSTRSSIWVPLGSIAWNWGATASRPSLSVPWTSGTVVNNGYNAYDQGENVSLPHWSGVYPPGPPVEPCPSPTPL